MKQLVLSCAKEMYLWGIKMLSIREKKRHQKIIFLLSFPSTSDSLLKELYKKFKTNIIICYSKNSRELAMCYMEKGCEIYPIDNYYLLLTKIAPKLTSANVILCDNYYAFLSVISFPKDTKVVQLWHANGAVKKFGLEAMYAKKSSKWDKERYSQVYSKFTNYVVSSDRMANIFSDNYHQSVNTLNFGYPPTDLFFDSNWLMDTKKKVKREFGDEKKILLYAPTYREKTELVIPVEALKKLSEDWLVIIKLHPHNILNKEKIQDENIIIDLKNISLRELLPSVDCLLTDYSSIPFEYSLANPKGRMVFYCYDYDEYHKEVGLEADFFRNPPGSVIKEEGEIIKEVNSKRRISLKQFNEEWNQYARGHATEQLMEWMRINNE